MTRDHQPRLTPDLMRRAITAFEQLALSGRASSAPRQLMAAANVDAATLQALLPAMERMGLIRRHVAGDHLVIELVRSGLSLTPCGSARREAAPVPSKAALAAFEAGPHAAAPDGTYLDRLRDRFLGHERREEEDADYFELATGGAL